MINRVSHHLFQNYFGQHLRPITYIGRASSTLLDRVNLPAWDNLCNFQPENVSPYISI
jgi:hypothetical protein